MTSPFTASQAGLASTVAAGLIVVSQVSQLVLPLTMPESFWIATQSLRMGLALLTMFSLLLALTGLYPRQHPEPGRLGLVGYLVAFLGTMLVAGNWWYVAFIVRRSGSRPRCTHHRSDGSIIVGAAITSVTFAAGWVIFGLASVRSTVFPGESRS